MNLFRKVRSIIEKEGLIRPGDRVLVALSGGIDSTALFFVLLETLRDLRFDLAVAHVNHGLRGAESMRDELFIRDLAAGHGIPVHVLTADVRAYARQAGLSVQHGGRDVRYGFFQRLAREHQYDAIAVAHNLDDQVETFIGRLVKGTGIRGLSAMPFRRGNIVRPFLSTSRQEIADFVKDRGIPFLEDSSNEKTVYERNYIRRNLIPAMERLNPQVRKKIILLLEDLTEINQGFDERAGQFLQRECRDEQSRTLVDVEAFARLDAETGFRVVAALLARLDPAFIPLREHVLLVRKLVGGKRPNRAVALPRGIRVKRVYGKLVFTKESDSPEITDVLSVTPGENTLEPFLMSLQVSVSRTIPSQFPDHPDVAYFDAAKTGNLSVRSFREGDRFFPLGMSAPVKLKDFFMARKIPREERRQIPLLLSGKDIIWVIGHRIDSRYKVEPASTMVLEVRARRR